MVASGISGAHRLNSRRQLVTSGLGQTSSTLLASPERSSIRIAVIACIVLPRPISSASTAEYRGYKNATPWNWYENGANGKCSSSEASSDSSGGCSRYRRRSCSLITSRGGARRVREEEGERGIRGAEEISVADCGSVDCSADGAGSTNVKLDTRDRVRGILRLTAAGRSKSVKPRDTVSPST